MRRIALTILVGVLLGMLWAVFVHGGEPCGFRPYDGVYPCAARRGTAWLDPSGFLEIRCPGPRDNPYLDAGWVEVFHAGEPDQPFHVPDIQGRSVVYCAGHAKSLVVVIDGMPPRDFVFARVLAGWVVEHCPRRERTLADVIVAEGLGSSKYATREAAHRWLARRGEVVLTELVAGLRSRDCEVRERCGLLLEQIRVGRSDP